MKPNKIDDNKTALTHRVTATAAAYLDSIGCKPIESEVGVSRGWVADLATFVYPTFTEWKKAKLNKRFAEDEYIKTGWYDSNKANKDYSTYFTKYGYLLTVLVEVKTALPDFRQDMSRKFLADPLPAHLCYVAAPVILKNQIDKIPNGWGYIITTKDGRRVHRVRAPRVNPQNPGDISDYIAAIAIRRDHRSRYTAMRSMMKSWRAKDSHDKKELKLNGALRALCQYFLGIGIWAKADSIKQAFGWENIKISNGLDKDLAALEKLLKRKGTK